MMEKYRAKLVQSDADLQMWLNEQAAEGYVPILVSAAGGVLLYPGGMLPPESQMRGGFMVIAEHRPEPVPAEPYKVRIG